MITIKYLNIDFTQIIIIKDVPDHLSDIKSVAASIFLSEFKYYSIFLHPTGEAARTYHMFHLCSILYNTNQLISNIIYKDNHHFVHVYPMINFVLDLSTHACHQKDSKLADLASEQLNYEHLNEQNN